MALDFIHALRKGCDLVRDLTEGPYESMKLDNIELSLDLIEQAARYSSQDTFIIKQI